MLAAYVCSAQSPLEKFLQLPLNTFRDTADAYINRNWPVGEVYDTGPYRTYFVGETSARQVTPGSFRLLLFYLGERVVDKELRLSATQQNVQEMLAQVRGRLENTYGRPTSQGQVRLDGVEGAAFSYTWEFKKGEYKDLYHIELTPHKFERPDYTIILVMHNAQYADFVRARDAKK